MTVRFSNVLFRAVVHCHVCHFAPLIQKNVRISPLFNPNPANVENIWKYLFITCSLEDTRWQG